MNIKCKLGFHNWQGCKCLNCGKNRDKEHDWSKDCENCSTCGMPRDNQHIWSSCICKICGKEREHVWNGCKCLNCGEILDEQHDWDGCKCIKCGRIRNEGHIWKKDDCNECSVCGKIRITGHDWDGCKCTLCGKGRGEGHSWDGCKCSKCGKIRNEQHNWDRCKCLACGKTRNEGHNWKGGKCILCGNAVDARTNQQLYEAIENGNVLKVKQCISNGANVNAVNHKGFYPLQRACKAWNSNAKLQREVYLEIVNVLIDAGADVNRVGKESDIEDLFYTPLHTAGGHLNVDIFLRLIEAGANPNVRDNKGRTPFQRAVMCNYRWDKDNIDGFWRLSELLEEGRSWLQTTEGRKGREAYDKICADVFQNVDWNDVHKIENVIRDATVKQLEQLSPQFNALHEAARRGYADLVKLILEKGVNVDSRSSTGETALIMALEFRYAPHFLNADVVKILMTHGASPDAVSQSGATPKKLALYLAEPTSSMKEEAKKALTHLSPELNHEDKYQSASASVVFPDFPLNPQNLFVFGEPIKDLSLANIATIGLCITSEIKSWKESLPASKFPAYANGELSALISAYNQMLAKVPNGIQHTVNVAEVRRLAALYIDRIRNNDEVYTKFMAKQITLLNFSIDFANTIACGGTLQTILQWYS